MLGAVDQPWNRGHAEQSPAPQTPQTQSSEN